MAASDHPAERRTGVVDGGGWEALSPPAARAPAARSSAAPPRAPAPGRAGDQDHVRHPEPAVERRAPLNGWRSVLRSLAATALGLGARSFDLAATLRETRARDETKALVREEQQQHACKSSSSALAGRMGLEAGTRRASPRARGVRTTVEERRPSIAARAEGESSTRVRGEAEHSRAPCRPARCRAKLYSKAC